MGIRKILLPLQFAATTAATYSAAVMVARLWHAHLAVLYTAVNRGQENAVRDLVERLTAEHGLAVAEARPDANEAAVSFSAVIGREPDIVVAHQARLADLIVVPHPAGAKEVSSSDTLHAGLFDSAKPVLIAPPARGTGHPPGRGKALGGRRRKRPQSLITAWVLRRGSPPSPRRTAPAAPSGVRGRSPRRSSSVPSAAGR